MSQMFRQPTHFFLVSGHAQGKTELNAFDHALLRAGVGDTKLVKMSSILPPSCVQIEPIDIPYGALVPVAYAALESRVPGAQISAAVAIAIPTDPTLPGLIMEAHGAEPCAAVERRAREMAIHGLQHRNREIKEILTASATCHVQECGAVFAGVVLWNSDGVSK